GLLLGAALGGDRIHRVAHGDDVRLRHAERFQARERRGHPPGRVSRGGGQGGIARLDAHVDEHRVRLHRDVPARPHRDGARLARRRGDAAAEQRQQERERPARPPHRCMFRSRWMSSSLSTMRLSLAASWMISPSALRLTEKSSSLRTRSFVSWRFWLIMITGAWMAASIDRNRFSRMNGYGSHARPPSVMLTTV